MSKHSNAVPGQYPECAGLIQHKLWPAVKGRLQEEDFKVLISEPEEVMLRLRGAFTKKHESDLVVPTSPFFAKEEVGSDRVYPEGYFHRPICEQLVLLSKHFTKQDASEILACSKSMPDLPPYAEHGFAMPKWKTVAKTYNEATEFVLDRLAASRTFKNWRAGELGQKYMRLSERTEEGLAILDNAYKGDYTVLPAQFGLMHRGRSTRKVRTIYLPHEFGLGPYETGVMLLSHPERLQGKPNELYVDCPGVEYSPYADGRFTVALYFGWCDYCGLDFIAHWAYGPFSDCGSASGLLPQ